METDIEVQKRILAKHRKIHEDNSMEIGFGPEQAIHAAMSEYAEHRINIELNGCDFGNHDVIPMLGFDNVVVGEQCRECGKKM